MVQASKFRNGIYPADHLDLSRVRALFLQRQMRTGAVVVIDVAAKGAFEMLGVKDDEVVQALPPYGADQTLGVRVVPGTLWRGQNFFDSERPDFRSKRLAVDSVAVADHVARCGAIRECFHDLLGRPLGTRMRCDVEVQDLSSPMFE